jgi:hypothetical protein
MDKLLEQILLGKGANASLEIGKMLNKKLGQAIQEQKSVVAEKVYGINEADKENRIYTELSGHLKKNHGLNKNGVLLTDYSKINGLDVHASSSNGTSGLGKYKGHKVYWSKHDPTQEFHVVKESINEDEGSIAGLEGRINNIRKQIESSGDPGGVRRAALKKLEYQLRLMSSRRG